MRVLPRIRAAIRPVLRPAAFAALFLAMALGLAAEAGRKPFKILILGDSLTEGYGVEKEDAFPALLAARLAGWRPGCREVVNAGSSRSTSATGVRRLHCYAKASPDLVLLALGSNDGLRGVKPADTRKHVEEAIRFCLGKRWGVALAGLQVPPNYGPDYVAAFAKVYPELAAAHKLPLMPFLLAGVAGEPAMNLADGIHPNEKGHRVIADSLFAFLRPLLERSLPAGPQAPK